MRDTSSTKLFVDCAFAVFSVVVFDTRTSVGDLMEVFCDNVCLELVHILIDTETTKSDLVFPGFFILEEHVYVMFHGSLAGRAPGGPKI